MNVKVLRDRLQKCFCEWHTTPVLSFAFRINVLKKNTIYWESFLGVSAGRDSTFLRSTESEMDYHLNNGALAYYPKLF